MSLYFFQVDFQKYAYELLITNELSGLIFECDSGPRYDGCQCNYPSFDYLIKYGDGGTGEGNNKDICEFTGQDVLTYYEYEGVSFTTWCLYMFAIFVFFKLATYILLKIRTWGLGHNK